MPAKAKPHFEVHPSVVYQLGESLITDAVQALIELVKNCYDADATYAKVLIDTKGSLEVEGAFYPATGGRVIVEDDGHGMPATEIESAWLVISNRKKRDLKLARKTTPGGRTPLGDKGLGRLGVQRLGDNLEIFTKSKGDDAQHFGFSWLDFATAPRLEDVEIKTGKTDFPRKHGTKIVVSDLREVDVWRGQESIKRLEQELSRMISPYKQIRDFNVLVEVDGKPLDLAEISDKIRDLAPIRYVVAFDGSTLSVKGKARLDFFRPPTQKEADQFALLVESDDGEAFYEFLQQQKLATNLHVSRSRSKQWFVDFSLKRDLEDIDKVKFDPNSEGKLANPGPFSGEIDAFDLGAIAFQQQSVFNRLGEFRSLIKEHSGIRVYRDGFAIRVDHDWLKLGAQWTSATSYYGLKPDNTLGFIALTARDNMDLEETTDREGFKDTAYYRNFYSLLSEFTAFTTTAQQFFRRSWTEFRKKRNEDLAQLDSRRTIEDISHAIKEGLTSAAKRLKSLEPFRARFQATAKDARAIVSRLESSTDITPNLRSKVTETLAELHPLLDDAQSVIQQISSYGDQVANLRDVGQVLEDRVEGLRKQMDDVYETVALGITAEALAHEVFNVADQLAQRTKTVERHVKQKAIADRAVLSFIEYVHSAGMSLRKQMSFLSPALQYVREQREQINVKTFLEELNDFYKERLHKNNIAINIRSSAHEDLLIRMNRGKLTQIIDNFVLNSEYWLKEAIAQRSRSSGLIIFELDGPFLRIWDDGRGIDPSVEGALFEPFISAKAKGQGRGLGLFIVKQLLDSEACSVGTLPERNKHRRLFKFQIDFRGAING